MIINASFSNNVKLIEFTHLQALRDSNFSPTAAIQFTITYKFKIIILPYFNGPWDLIQMLCNTCTL